MTTAKDFDNAIAPLMVACNKARQVRDALPPFVWISVPVVIRGPIDEIFRAVEAYETTFGRLANPSSD